MPEYTIRAVSEKQPEAWSFKKDGQTINLLTFLIKVAHDDRILRLYRSPQSGKPKDGEKLVGEIIEEERGLRLKVDRTVGRTGARDNPREIRANMAVKTAFQAAVMIYGGEGNKDNIAAFTKEWASTIYDLATELSEKKAKE